MLAADTRKAGQEVKLIDYKPFWETLRHSNETTYSLVTRHRVSGATIDKLRKNKPMNTTTLDGLCGILECALPDIVRYVPDRELEGEDAAEPAETLAAGTGKYGRT